MAASDRSAPACTLRPPHFPRADYPTARGLRHPAVELAGAAVFLGVLGRLLLGSGAWGIGFPLWVLVMVGLITAGSARWGQRMPRERAMLLGVAVLFATAVAWRAAELLTLLNVAAVLLLLALAGWSHRAGRLRDARIVTLLQTCLRAGVNAAGGCAILLGREMPWGAEGRAGERKSGWAGVVRGLMVAAPMMVVFGALFASADPAFERAAGVLFSWDTGELLPALLIAGIFAWLSAGYLRQMLFGVAPAPSAHQSSPYSPDWFGATEVATILGLLNLLFGSFVSLQLPYLFGGTGRIAAMAGLGVAEYARRGFFELAFVAALVLPLLLGLHALLGSEDRCAQRRFRWLAGALLLLLFVIMASAAQRMQLYQQAYGLTELRLYTSVFMGWLALVFVWFGATVLRGPRQRFAWGATVAGLATVAVLDLMNPSALVARVNLARLSSGAAFDAEYLTQLGGDAVPPVAAAFPSLQPADQCSLARWISSHAEPAAGDWRHWNFGRARASEAARSAVLLRDAACAPGREQRPGAHLPSEAER